MPYRSNLHEGDIALRSIYAPFSFTYDGELDTMKTEDLRKQAREAICDVYDKDLSVEEGVKRDLVGFFDFTTQAQKDKKLSLEQLIERLKMQQGITLSESTVLNLTKADNTEKAKNASLAIAKNLFSQSIVSLDDKQNLLKKGEDKIIVRQVKEKSEKEQSLKKLISLDEAKKQVRDLANKSLKGNKKLGLSVTELIGQILRPNLKSNADETQRRRQQAEKLVPNQYKQVKVKKQELIASKGQRITRLHLVQLAVIGQKETGPSMVIIALGFGLLTFLFLVAFCIYLKLFEKDVYARFLDLLLISIFVIALVIVTRFIILSPWSSYSIPLAAVSMLIAVLIYRGVAVIITLLLSVLIGVMVGNNINIATSFLLGGVIGVFAVKDSRQRYHILRAGFLIGGANFVAIAALGILNNLGYATYTTEGLWGFLNGIVCSFVAMGFLPLFEHIFRKTTNITLLELSDMNQPLLKKLILNAPGTYHHSLLVGNLAEAACETIGANSLLARVGSYYHDIGKMEKPEYFSENQAHVKSAHEKLTLSMSRLIIANHVKDGVELGRKNNLTPAILDFIAQHHGDSLIYYFYQKALEKIEDESMLKEDGFRYPGPKPQTKETAVVLLADSVEAASRTLQNPTASRIEDLVHRIINNKFIDGQLDECKLTLQDLHKIAQAFSRVLTGVFHTRVEYPDAEKKKS